MYASHFTKSSSFIFINTGKAQHYLYFYESIPRSGVKQAIGREMRLKLERIQENAAQTQIMIRYN